MVKNHIKRIAAPKTWRILRKEHKFITKPTAGGHKSTMGISINTFLKDMTSTTNTTKETKFLLTKQEVHINGTRKRSHKAQVGFMDIITVPSLKKHYRVTIDKIGKLVPIELTEAEAKQTLQKITSKKILKNKKVQLGMLSGMTILTDKDEYKTGDSIIISLPDKKIVNHIKRDKGVQVFVFTGKHTGKQGSLEEIKEGNAFIKTKEGIFQTNKEYMIITGKTKTEVKLE